MNAYKANTYLCSLLVLELRVAWPMHTLWHVGSTDLLWVHACASMLNDDCIHSREDERRGRVKGVHAHYKYLSDL